MNNSYNDTLLMCAPEHYKIDKPNEEHGHANDFAYQGYIEYTANPARFVAKAIKQWEGLKDRFTSLGLNIVELEPQKELADIVFTADPSLSLITTDTLSASNSDPRIVTITSRFSNEERQGEVDHSVSFIEKFSPKRGVVSAHYNTEGTGDNFYDSFRDAYWSGFVKNAGRKNAASGRSDIRSHSGLEALTGVPVISMAVKRPFFHIDTSMTPLSNGHIIAYKDGMMPEAFETLKREGFERYGMDADEYLILVDKEDADKYACNLRCVGNTIVMPSCSDDLQDRLKSKGYDVVTHDMSQFIYAGGAMHCLTNNLNEKRVKGGTCVQKGYERKPTL